MNCIGAFHRSKIKTPFASRVHGMVVFHSLFIQPGHHLKSTDSSGIVLLDNGNGIGNMIAMSMRQQNIISPDIFYINVLRKWVWTDEWIKQQVLTASFYSETRLSVIGQFHTEFILGEGKN